MEKNLFRIVRKAHAGDENQLTEMFAWLLQEQPDLIAEILVEAGVSPIGAAKDSSADEAGADAPSAQIDSMSSAWELRTQVSVEDGFLDLELSAPGVLVIIESKLGSVTDYAQIAKYLRYARGERAGQRALILLTREVEAYPAGVEKEAAGEVQLVRLRWWDVAEVARGSGGRLGAQFADMLEWEGIVKPAGFTTEDWQTMNAGVSVVRRVGKLLVEAREKIAEIEPGQVGVVAQPVYSGGGYVYVLARFEEFTAGLGFWASVMPPEHNSDGDVHIIAYVLNTRPPVMEQIAAARRFVKAVKNGNVKMRALPETQAIQMSGWSEGHVQRSAPAATILDTTASFDTQTTQAVGFLKDTIDLFREAGYLSPGSPPPA